MPGASQRFWGASSSGSRKVGRAVDSESGKRSEEAEMCKLVGEGWRRRAVLCSWTDVGFNFYELRWAMTQHVNSISFEDLRFTGPI